MFKITSSLDKSAQRSWLSSMKKLVRRLLILVSAMTMVLVVLSLVVVPVAAATLGPTLLRNAGLHSDNLSVHLNTSLNFLTGKVDSLTISSGPLEVENRFSSANANVTLEGANLTNNTFTSLSVAADEPVATMASGEVIKARSLRGQGPANAISAEARFSAADLLAIVALPAVTKRLDLTITDLTLSDGVVRLQTPDGGYQARLAVDATGRLLLTLDDGTPRVLWDASGPDAQNWQLTGVSIDANGVTATALVNGAAFLARYPSLGDLFGGFLPAL
jgi:hypothetical protein